MGSLCAEIAKKVKDDYGGSWTPPHHWRCRVSIVWEDIQYGSMGNQAVTIRLRGDSAETLRGAIAHMLQRAYREDLFPLRIRQAVP